MTTKAQLWQSKSTNDQKLMLAKLIDAMIHSDVATIVIEQMLQNFIDNGYIKSKFLIDEFVANPNEEKSNFEV